MPPLKKKYRTRKRPAGARSARASFYGRGTSGLPAGSKRPYRPLNKTTVNVGLGFPKKLMMTHKYSEVIVPTCSSGALSTYTFSCNSLYDPNVTSTGHQPMYFDQLTALYDHYTVIGAVAIFKVTHLVPSNYSARVGCFINDDSTVTPSTMDALCENSLSRHRLLAAGQTTPVTFTMKWSAKKTFGGSILANDNLQGSASASPTEQSMFTLMLQPTDSITTSSFVVDVSIKYTAIWDELKDIASS